MTKSKIPITGAYVLAGNSIAEHVPQPQLAALNWMQMAIGPKQILFQEAMLPDGSPLFRSQVDLAEQVKLAPGAGFEDRDVQSIRVFINQVLLPASVSRSRPLSPNLEKALHWAIGSRLENAQRAGRVIEQLRKSFAELKDASEGQRPVDDEIEWPAMFEAAQAAKTHIVFTPSPAEVRSHQEHAQELTRELIRRAIDPKTIEEEDIEYRFYIFDKAEAVRMRELLVSEIAAQAPSATLSKKKAWELLKAAESSGRLNVYALKIDLWHPQIVIFDPETSNISGFGLSYHENNAVSVMRLSAEELKVWYKKTYLPLKSGRLDDRLTLVREYPNATESLSSKADELISA